MSAIKIINANEGRRDPVASDRVTVYTDGYKNLFTSGTTPSIADIVAGIGGDPAGTIPLSNVHVPGTDDLMVWINGQLLLENGVDFTEVGLQKILLSAGWLALITADPANSKIKVIWNRALPGARDQLFQHLQNCPPAIEGSILDDDGGGPYRTAPATALNPLATLADVAAVPTPLAFVGFRGVKASVQVMGGGAMIVAAYDTEAFAVGAGFNPTTGVYTVPAGQGGYYRFSASVAWDNVSTSRQLTTQIVTSGGTEQVVMINDQPLNEVEPQLSLSGLFQLAAGQTAHVYVTSPAGNEDIQAATFSGNRVG